MAWRDQNRLHRTAGGDRGGVVARVTLFLHFRHHHRAYRRGIRHRRAGDRAEEGGGDDIDQRQAAAYKTDEDIGETDQPAGDAAFRHNGAGQDKERDRQQGELVDAAGHLDHQRFQRQVDPQRAGDGAQPHGVGHRHADGQQQGERSKQDKGVHSTGSVRYCRASPPGGGAAGRRVAAQSRTAG